MKNLEQRRSDNIRLLRDAPAFPPHYFKLLTRVYVLNQRYLCENLIFGIRRKIIVFYNVHGDLE